MSILDQIRGSLSRFDESRRHKRLEKEAILEAKIAAKRAKQAEKNKLQRLEAEYKEIQRQEYEAKLQRIKEYYNLFMYGSRKGKKV